MNRRALLATVAGGTTATILGIAVRNPFALDLDPVIQTEAENESRSAPRFEVDESAAGRYILLRMQPQDPVPHSGATVGEPFEIGIVVGNAGGEPATGSVTVEFVPPNDDESAETVTLKPEETPSGATRFLITEPFEPTVEGEWRVVAGDGFADVHPQYDGTITVDSE